MRIDLQLALRSLARSRTFTLTAVLTLALGIGASTAIFSIVYGVLLKPLPFAAPDRLVSVVDIREGARVPSWTSPADFEQWRQRARRVERLALYRDNEQTVTGHGEPELTKVGMVSDGFFATLGTPPAAGRVPGEAEADQPVAVLSYSFVQRRFGGGGAIGATLMLDGRPYTVVGIMPPGFEFPSKGVSLWIPRLSVPGAAKDTKGRWYRMIGRVREGSSFAEAHAEVRAIAAGLAVANRRTGRPDTQVRALEDELVGDVRHGLLLLFAVVGILLFVAAINVGSLTLSRAAMRQGDLAVRAALGAGRWHLLRHLLAESIVLVSAGAAGGVLLAAGLSSALVRLVAPETPRISEVTVSVPVLCFTLAVSAGSVLLIGLVPAWHACRLSPGTVLALNGGATRQTARNGRTRFTLIALETALSTVVLVAALLTVRSLGALLHVESGRPVNNVLTLGLTLPSPAYAKCYPDPRCMARAAAFVRDVRARAAAIPGVQSVAVTTSLPPHQSLMAFTGTARNPGTGRDEAYVYNIVAVDGDYFKTLGITALRGRLFNDRDATTAEPVVIVSRDLARRRFGREDVVGERVPLPPKPPIIVGVVDDVRYGGLDRPTGGAFYLPYQQAFNPSLYLVVRTAGSPFAVAGKVREAVHALDSQVPLGQPRTLRQLRHASVAEPESRAILLGALAVLALALASVGLYGNSAYATTQRTFEVGLRMALGATPPSVFRLLVTGGLGPVALGLGVGLGGAAALSRFVATLLFGVRPLDPLTFAGVPALLLLVAAAAVSLPAHRATRIEPSITLRQAP